MSATRHAADRALERHALQLSKQDADAIVLDIINTVDGKAAAVLLRRDLRHGAEEWLVHLQGRDVRVRYSPVNATIITVLP